tara:strand:- start:284 stop:475 length:192 start_codon:yes stop_codon:yes gene_type:complete
MAKFKCKACKKELHITEFKIMVVDENVVSPEAKCCGKYMEFLRSNKGFGGIIKKPSGTVGGKF